MATATYGQKKSQKIFRDRQQDATLYWAHLLTPNIWIANMGTCFKGQNSPVTVKTKESHQKGIQPLIQGPYTSIFHPGESTTDARTGKMEGQLQQDSKILRQQHRLLF